MQTTPQPVTLRAVAADRPAPFPRPAAPQVPPAPGASVLGRAWLNGREVGGAAARFAHLSASHD